MRRMPSTMCAVLVLVALVAFPAAAADDLDGSVRIEGSGFGHGVGMSQYGARSMATKGSSATQILQYYYSGVSVSSVSTGGNLLVGLTTTNAVDIYNRADSQNALTVHLGGGNTLAVSPNARAEVRYVPGPSGAATTNCTVKVGTTTRSAVCGDLRVTWPYTDTLPRTFVRVPRTGGLHDLTLARGSLSFAQPTNRANGNLHLRLRITMQEYLFGLSEMPSSWPEAALQAQAITGRTYAQRTRASLRAACSCNIGTTVSDQHYTGWAKEGEATWGLRWTKAVRDTNDRVVTRNGALVTTFYSSSSGGHTEYAGDIWGTDLAHLVGKPDPHSVDASAANPNASWTRTPTYAAFVKALGMDSVTSMRVIQKNRSGSPHMYEVVGTSGGRDRTVLWPATDAANATCRKTPATCGVTKSGQTVRSALGLPSHVVKRLSIVQPAALEWHEGDFNGDNHTDVAGFNHSTGDWIVGTSTGTGYTFTTWSNFATKSGWTHHLVGDFTKNGNDDIASYHEPTGRWWVNRSSGTSFSPALWASLKTNSGWAEHLVGDFAGDGFAHIASYHPSNGSWWVHGSTGSRFRTRQWATFNTRTGWSTHLVGDVDNDNKDDLISFHPRTGTWWVSKATGTGFTGSRWASYSPDQEWIHLAGDFTGDKRADIASYHPRKGAWWVGRSDGTRFTVAQWATFGTPAGWTEHVTGRFAHKDRDSIASYHPSNGTWWVSAPSGQGFQTSRWAQFGTTTGWHKHLVGDANQDGFEDLIGYHPSNRSVWVHTSDGKGFTGSRWGLVR